MKNVFINLPTGSEKSIIYQLAPLVSLRLEDLSPNTGLGKSDAIHVVVSPLISLMFFALEAATVVESQNCVFQTSLDFEKNKALLNLSLHFSKITYLYSDKI